MDFPSHAEFVLEMRMAKTADAVKSFLEDLAAKLQPLKVKEMEGFLEYKKEEVMYSKSLPITATLKRPKIGFQDYLSLNAGQKYCWMLQGEHSAILAVFIKLPFVINIFFLSFFEWLLKTGFTIWTCPYGPFQVYNTSSLIINWGRL